MEDLKILDLSYNKIGFIHPITFNSNPKIEHLNVSNNCLDKTTSLTFLSKLHNLKKLDISENLIYNLSLTSAVKPLHPQTLTTLETFFFKQKG